MNTYYFLWNTYGNIINSSLTCVIGIVVVAAPVFFTYFYTTQKNYKKILEEDEDFLASCGELIEPLNLKRKGKLALLYIGVSQLRRLILIITVVYLQDYPLYSLFSIIFQSLMMIFMVGLVYPFKSNTENRMDLFNESFILFSSYHLICFTNFLADMQA